MTDKMPDGSPKGEREPQGPPWVYDPVSGKLTPRGGWPIKGGGRA